MKTNYRPVSPICEKIFEKIIFNSLLVHLNLNNLLNSNQSGFRTGNPCVHHLTSRTYDIYKAFDANPSLEVRGAFLDLLKAFGKACIGIYEKYFELLDSFLSDRFQRALLNSQTSKWSQIKAGVLQCSILGPLLFLVYINDLPGGLTSEAKIFFHSKKILPTIVIFTSIKCCLYLDAKFNFSEYINKK